MVKIRVFISSVQKELIKERNALFDHFSTNALLNNFFEPVMFEKFPAASQTPEKVYLKEVEHSQLYLMLLGNEYGYEDGKGLSPTESEYNHAQSFNIDSLAFIKGSQSRKRHTKEQLLIEKIQNTLSYRRFNKIKELISEVDKACVALLKHKGLIQLKNFDETASASSNLDDINTEKLDTFIGIARAKRGFPLRIGTPVKKLLSHLNMLENDQLTNGALLAFGDKPQKYFKSAIVKCAHFHGLHVEKPMPDHKVISGDVFEQVDQAVDFVLSKITVTVGLRDKSNQAPLDYEIPRPVIAEAIVNAVAHRDYYSQGSVQVMLFADRLEISNPGHLPPELSIEKLKMDHGSYPPNQLLAETLYQTGYIERYGTGTGEIFRLTKEVGLQEPVFSLDEGFRVVLWRKQNVTDQATDQATDQVSDQAEDLIKRLLIVLDKELGRGEIMSLLDLRHPQNFRENYLFPALELDYVEMTLPDKPTSPKQKYRLTKKGKALKVMLEGKCAKQNK